MSCLNQNCPAENVTMQQFSKNMSHCLLLVTIGIKVFYIFNLYNLYVQIKVELVTTVTWTTMMLLIYQQYNQGIEADRITNGNTNDLC